MECNEKYFSNHSIRQMFERSISKYEVDFVIKNGEIIIEYVEDKPYPSYLLLHVVNSKFIHVLVAKDERGNCIVVTAYYPDIKIWNNDFKTKRI